MEAKKPPPKRRRTVVDIEPMGEQIDAVRKARTPAPGRNAVVREIIKIGLPHYIAGNGRVTL